MCSDSDKDTGNKERELQTVDTLMRNADKIDEFLSSHDKRIGVGNRKKEVQSNITDNDSTKMTTSKGTIQGCNCQAASDETHQIVVATEAFGVGQDQSLLKPMVEEIKKQLGTKHLIKTHCTPLIQVIRVKPIWNISLRKGKKCHSRHQRLTTKP